jgi:Rieske Fe-S protein
VQLDRTTGAGTGGRKVTRRNFIVWYLAGLLTAFALAVLAPLLVYIWPTGAKVKNAIISVTLKTPLNKLADQSVVQFNAPNEMGFKMVDGGGDNYPGKVTFGGYAIRLGGTILVLSVTCSHLGCSVDFETSGHYFHCPCHGSEFFINGALKHGPAQAPLSHLGWKLGSSPSEIQVEGYSLPGVA